MQKLQHKAHSLQFTNKTRKFFLFLVFCFTFSLNLYAQDVEKDTTTQNMPFEPIVVNGDKVEFSTEQKEITASGNVVVIYKGVKLTCAKLTVNSQTKVGVAEGNARLEDPKGVIEGPKIIYNFATKTGTIIDSYFRANPYFGRGQTTEKVSDTEFIVRRGIMTTCNYDNPHYRIKSRKMNIFPGDKVQTKDDVFYIGRAPLLYLPQLNRSLKDPLLHVQFLPGKSKEWGPYLLSAWRYNLTEDITGRIYFDWRQDLGVAEGFGVNYTTQELGKGDFKYYYTRERNHTKDFPPEDVTLTRKFQRYLIRWRHQWDIDPLTNLVAEYWKLADSKYTLYRNHTPAYNFLKEYFYREYETDMQPLSYVLVHRAFSYGGVDFMMQKRTNRWYSQLEKLPEIKFSLPSYHIEETPFYFEHESLAANYNYKNAAPSPSGDDKHSIRFDMNNKVSLPLKVAFVKLTPFAKHEGTYYHQDIYGAASVFRTIFSTGADASSKFFRIFNINSNLLGLDINGLRHIVTPSIAYTYQNKPTVPSYKLVQIDNIDSISGRSNSATLELSNILQTKRKNATINFVDFLISAPYTFKTRDTHGSKLGDFSLKLTFLPYSRMALYADAIYCMAHSSPHYQTFSNVNYDINFDLGRERAFGFGQRYQRKGSNEMTYSFRWRVDPKWKFSIYQRFNTGHRDPSLKRGLREQEYTLSRDLHCWIMDITYNVTRDKGESIFIAFRLKAFPELNFNYNQTYHEPKPGELSY
jgi:hypothetical protein